MARDLAWEPPWGGGVDVRAVTPGEIPEAVEPTPRMAVAHRVDGLSYDTHHASERLAQVAKMGPGLARDQQVGALRSHLDHGLDHAHRLVKLLREHYGAEGAEYDALTDLMPTRSSPAPAASTAHLAQTIQYQLAHASRHAASMAGAKDKALFDFDVEHCRNHVDGALEHVGKIRDNLVSSYPAEGKYLQGLAPGAGEGEAGS